MVVRHGKSSQTGVKWRGLRKNIRHQYLTRQGWAHKHQHACTLLLLRDADTLAVSAVRITRPSFLAGLPWNGSISPVTSKQMLHAANTSRRIMSSAPDRFCLSHSEPFSNPSVHEAIHLFINCAKIQHLRHERARSVDEPTPAHNSFTHVHTPGGN